MFETLNRFFSEYGKQKPDISAAVLGLTAGAASIYTLVIRCILPALAILILIRCILPLLGGRKAEKPWGYLAMPNGVLLPLLHGENSIGRSRLSDVVINLPFISRSHAVLTYGDGGWTVFDPGARGGIRVNGEKVENRASVKRGDIISLSGLDLTLFGADDPVAEETGETPGRAGHPLHAGATLGLIAVFQILGCLQLLFSGRDSSPLELLAVFGVFLLAEYLDYWITGRKQNDPELKLLAYFLCGIGLFVVASASPRSLVKQLAAILIGMILYSAMTLLIRDLDRAQKLKKGLMAAALALMALNLVIGQTRNGAKNWIDLGVLTFQPMEFVKIAFVLAGAATLDRLLTTRNLTAFIAFSGACVGTLALTKDFGTALVFFCAFLVIAFMRSGDIRTIALICAGAVLAAVAVVAFMPYVTARFSVWGHVWQHADSTGYQQTFVVASASPRSLVKQLAAILIGMILYSAMTLLIRDLDRAQKLKKGLMAAALALMALNLVIGQTRNGAKNWIDLGVLTFQPMEFVKIAFVLAGAATLDRLLTTRNLTAFIAFSGACVGTLALTKDFGTALVFFCAFLVIAFMRSGDIRTIALICAGAVLAAVAVVAFMPYVTARFSVWGHVWQHADSTGYQQTRTMIALASGGFLGVGGGKGYLARIGAADTDLAFGVIGEEWGLAVALAAVLAITFLAFFSLSSVKRCRSSFYAIAACGASVIFLIQTALNVLGSVDILPLTGVTMPFVSNGGSSMVVCWCLLAFVRSADEPFRPEPADEPAGGEERSR